MSAVSLEGAFQQLQSEVDKLLKVETIDDKTAVAAAAQLADIAEGYLREVCRSDNDQTLKQTLKKREIPLPLAYKTIEILTHPAFQFKDDFKRELSKSTRIFFELIICQCMQQGRRLYPSAHEKFYTKFKEMIKTLPDEEVLCRFELKCCRAALHNLSSFVEDTKSIAKKNIVPIGIGTILTILSANASPPYVNPAPALACMADLIQDIYKAQPEWWYGKVLSLKWHSFESGLQSLDIYTQKRKGKTTIKNKLVECQSNPNLAFYICQVFNTVIRDSTDSALKQELFEGEGISLVHLAEHKPRTSLKDNHWKVRYLALSYLEKLMENSSYCTQASQRAMVRRMTKTSERGVIRKKAKSVCEKLLDQKRDEFINLITLTLEDIDHSLGEASRKGITRDVIETRITDTASTIKKLEDTLNLKKISTLENHSTGDVSKSEEAWRKELKEAQDSFVDYKFKQEKLNDSTEQRKMLKAILETRGLDGIRIE